MPYRPDAGSLLGINISDTLPTDGQMLCYDSVLDQYVPENVIESDTPLIRVKKLTGITGAAEGDITNITHGLTVGKIIGMQVLVTQSSNNRVPPSFTDVAEHEYDVFILASVVRVVLTATNSGSIVNGAITVLLTYEE